jgi:hypothetical protein
VYEAWQSRESDRDDRKVIIIPIRRKKSGAVKRVAAKLVRRHRLACYDPEAGKLIRPRVADEPSGRPVLNLQRQVR